MAIPARTNRVTGLLDDEAKERLRAAGSGYSSSGSDHGASTCLSGLVHAFLETGGRDTPSDAAYSEGASDPDERLDDDASEEWDRAAADTVRELMNPRVDMNLFRGMLAGDVSTAAEALAWLRSSCGESAFRRAVMARLRAAGFNAGICKARWDASGGLAAGSYEYIDVVAAATSGKETRYIVDLDFAAEFEVARATEEYKAVVAAVPRVAVAEEEAIRRSVRAVADAARRSLRARGLHVPPWRKSRYMLAKWMGPYRRTTNPVPASSLGGMGWPAAEAAGPRGGDVQCRAVGFPAASRLVAPSTARTR
ncbi:hypothetical protein Cni_G13132 [Canna indica]|uniref:Uncharacterized protein n=1 Tax=Canna indica TaxID=4628 RepID=A0AAQ3QCE8_9LILI|nr:hypothetical protein Cni_G13132 [Canna indica]